MTWTQDDALAREHAPVSRGARTARWRRSAVAALVGAVVLGALGAGVAALGETRASASALVLSSPDPAAVENPADPGSALGDQAARNATYLETELVYLDGNDLAGQVAAASGGEQPELGAARVGSSNVVEITATAATAGAARTQAQSAADLYVQGRRDRLATRIAEQIAVVDQQIEATSTQVAELDAVVVQTAAQEQQADTLRQQYADQLRVKDTLTRAAGDVNRIATQVQGAVVRPAGALSPLLTGALLGALVGLLLGALVPVLRDATSSRVRDVDDLADLDVPVLTPALPGPRKSGSTGAELRRAVQLQALQLTAGAAGGGSLAVVAGSAGAGTSFVAQAHARHAARRGPTLLVRAAGPGAGDITLGVVPDHEGLTELDLHSRPELTGDDLVRAAQRTSEPDLRVLCPGRASAYQDVDADTLAAVVATARELGWAVVVDAPALDVSDLGVRLSRVCDQTVLVVAAHRTAVDDVAVTVQVLQADRGRLSGVLLNQPPRRSRKDASAPRGDERDETQPHEGDDTDLLPQPSRSRA